MRGRDARLTRAEELLGPVHRHREHLADVPAAETVLQHRGLEPLALAVLAGTGHAGHHGQVGVDDTGAVAGGAGALGVGAEEGRLDAVGLGEGLADRVEQSRVGRRVAAPGALDGALVDRDDVGVGGERSVDQGALAGARHAGDHAQDAERDVHVDVLEVVGVGAADLQGPGGPADRLLEGGPVVEVAAGDGVGGAQFLDGALEADGAARGAGAGAEVDHVVGDGDRLRLVLDDEDRVALVAQAQQQVVHPLDVVGVQSDGGLVEDVGGVGERGAEVADHLDALRLAAGQGARGPVEGEVAEADLHEGVEGVPQRGEQRGDRGLGQVADPLGQVADLHGAGVGDADLPDPRRAGALAEPGALALGTGGEGDGPLHEGPDVRLQALLVLGQEGLLDLRDEPFVGEVDAVDLHLDRFAVEEVPQLLLRVLADRLVRVDEAGLGVDLHGPLAVRLPAGDGEGALGERLGVVVELGEVDVGDGAAALAVGAHAAGALEGRLHGLLAAPFDGDGAAGPDRGGVEGVRAGRADVRVAEAAEEDAQHRVDVGGGADGGAGVGAHALLVHDDRGGQALQHVHLGPREGGHEALDERAVGLVDEPLRLGGDRVEDQRALARAGDSGEHGQPALGDLDADVLEVVLAGAVHTDQVVAVGDVRSVPLRARPLGAAHRVSIRRGPAEGRRPRCLGGHTLEGARPPALLDS